MLADRPSLSWLNVPSTSAEAREISSSAPKDLRVPTVRQEIETTVRSFRRQPGPLQLCPGGTTVASLSAQAKMVGPTARRPSNFCNLDERRNSSRVRPAAHAVFSSRNALGGQVGQRVNPSFLSPKAAFNPVRPSNSAALINRIEVPEPSAASGQRSVREQNVLGSLPDPGMGAPSASGTSMRQ